MNHPPYSDHHRNVGELTATRRGFLGATGGVAATALWSGLSQAALAQPEAFGKAKSVIMIFNCGGPSHIDLWDPKPNAGDSVRGPFQTIDTNVPGIHVTEMLPRMAKMVDKLAILRTVNHTQAGHNSGMYYSTVGRPYRIDSTLINPSPADYPSLGTLVGWLARRDGYSSGIPPYVIAPYPHCDSTVYITPGQYGGCLGMHYDPLVLDADPNDKDFKVRNLKLDPSLTPDKFRERLSLLNQMNQKGIAIASPSATDIDLYQSQAASIVSTDKASEAFDLSKETTELRDRYGRHTWGQSHLLARRLVESGVRFVSAVNGRSIIWDTHLNNFDRMKKSLVPPMEQAYATLLEDLEDRGLLDTTLVIWTGDFGRTPIINKDAGRDHWPQCYTVVLAGAGIRGGQVVGESDKTGAFPHSRPISPADINATVFTAMGYDPRSITYRMLDGRPIPLSEGAPIREVL
ncbi:DUF1501 domain-containing protein [Schlesneria sp. T3-172]|uniref:DUF1501 domain-containing protein n=1 Tax=Schlesneria sphaerica TaxID=3373610 RepID=UPI0037C73722